MFCDSEKPRKLTQAKNCFIQPSQTLTFLGEAVRVVRAYTKVSISINFVDYFFKSIKDFRGRAEWSVSRAYQE